jgi:hypothetical protein
MAGKGDKRRPGDDARFRKSWERVFGKKRVVKNPKGVKNAG